MSRAPVVGVPLLIDAIAFGGLIANKAFDSNAIIADLDERQAAAIISQHPRLIGARRIDLAIYARRRLIENVFCKLKAFKRIPMRACKTDRSFDGMIYLAAVMIWLR